MAPPSAMADSSLYNISELTPEKLSIMRINNENDHDVFNDPGTPTELSRSRFVQTNSRASGLRSMSRASRQVSGVSGVSRRASTFIQSHRSKMSTELNTQAESKFMALMELMTSASKEASSLKEYWLKLMTERETWERERESYLLQIEEITETLQSKDNQHSTHYRELANRKKEVERLLLELTASFNATSEQKRLRADKETDLDRSYKDLNELRVSFSRIQIDHDKVKSDLERVHLKLTTAESDRDKAKTDAEKYRTEHRTLTRQTTELESKNRDIVTHLESVRREVTTTTERIRVLERENTEHVHEKGHVQEELRRALAKNEELTVERNHLKDRTDHLQRDNSKLKESLNAAEFERDDLSNTSQRLRQELTDKTSRLDDTESRLTDVRLKYDQVTREVTTKDERSRVLEAETRDVRDQLSRRDEELSLMTIDRDHIKADLDSECVISADNKRHADLAEESLRTTETKLGEIRTEVVQLTERLTRAERERDDSNTKFGQLGKEIITLKERVTVLQSELTKTAEARDRARRELAEMIQKYETVTEEISEWNNDTSEFEMEIENLRLMLREAREQKETAISARSAADHERDEALSKYEEKCRQLERLEESRASEFASSHGHGSSMNNRSSSVRITKSSSSGGAKSSAYNSGGLGYASEKIDED